MKIIKYCLILVAVMCLAGPAQAAWSLELQDINGNPLPSTLTMTPGTEMNFSLHNNDQISSSAYYIKYKLVGIYGYDGTDASLLTCTRLDEDELHYAGGAAVTHYDVMTLDMDSAAVSSDKFLVKVAAYAYDEDGVYSGVYDQSETMVAGAEGTQDITVPEFPTIALPVAAILGLAFFMQRRKEE